jgi:hypothetical protein
MPTLRELADEIGELFRSALTVDQARVSQFGSRIANGENSSSRGL